MVDSSPPNLALSFGQAEWALWYPRFGLPIDAAPTPEFRARLLYLREHGVPFKEDERMPGSGRNLVYGFDHLMELALAIELTDHNVKPGDAAVLIVANRKKLRPMFRRAYALKDELYQFEDPEMAIGKGLYLEVTIRRTKSSRPIVNDLELLNARQATDRLLTMEGSRASAFFIALSELVNRAVITAQEAPTLKRGRPKIDG